MSQIASVARRLRISLLLDAYGELLPEKQLAFMRQHYDDDLSFGEIAAEYDLTRQAIFDAVRHGEETLEHFESVLHLIEQGWAQLIQAGWTAHALQSKLLRLQKKLETASPAGLASARGLLEKIITGLQNQNSTKPFPSTRNPRSEAPYV